MATVTKVLPDEFAPDGVTRLFNQTRPHGVVFADGFSDARYVQDGIQYRADGYPVGYVADPTLEGSGPVPDVPMKRGPGRPPKAA